MHFASQWHTKGKNFVFTWNWLCIAKKNKSQSNRNITILTEPACERGKNQQLDLSIQLKCFYFVDGLLSVAIQISFKPFTTKKFPLNRRPAQQVSQFFYLIVIQFFCFVPIYSVFAMHIQFHVKTKSLIFKWYIITVCFCNFFLRN